MDDTTQIDADRGDQRPTDLSDASNHDHERSPVLLAPVANVLDQPWYLGSKSPGSHVAIRLDVERRIPVQRAFPVPSAYVVAYGMVHFRGPDGYVWFVPDNGNTCEFSWDCPQNIAEFDERNCDEDARHHDLQYQAAMAEICLLVDGVLDADKAYRAGLPSSH